MKRIAILGSTGSIGKNTLKVIGSLNQACANDNNRNGQFKVVGLAAYSNTACLLTQVKRFRTKWVCLIDESSAKKARSALSPSYNILAGSRGLETLIEDCGADVVVLAISGSDALMPLMKAINCKKTIILANKEALVSAGSIIMRSAEKNKVKILPVDSEQSAIWQCLEGEGKEQLSRIYLTASGGPFCNYSAGQFKNITLGEVLSHPCWRMGKRITVDSATMMNKGLEIIEATHLFDVRLSQIEVVIHPEAIIHSMVEFLDGVILAQLSITDMRIPIQYALTYPNRTKNRLRPLDFFKLKRLNFQKPSISKFPCLGLAIQACREGGSMPCVLNAADEICVGEFLRHRIKFNDIPRIISRVMNSHKKINNPCLEEILDVDSWARIEAQGIIKKLQ